MKRFLVVVGILTVLIAAAVGVFFYGVKSYLTPEKVSALVSKRVEASLHHKVKLGPVTTGFSSAEIEGFSILPNNPKDPTPLLTVRGITLSFSLKSLLKKKLKLRKVAIMAPHVYLVREENGVLNWRSEFSKVNVGLGKKDRFYGRGFSMVTEACAAEAGRSGAVGLAVQVEKVEIREGSLTWIDRLLKPAYKATLVSLSADIEDVSMDETISFRIRGKFKRHKEAPFQLEGTLNLVMRDLEGEAHFPTVYLADLGPYLEKKGTRVVSGTAGLTLKLKTRHFQVCTAEGEAKVEALVLKVGSRKTKAIQGTLKGSVLYSAQEELLKINGITGKIVKSDFSLSGKIRNIRTSPVGELTFTSNRMDLDALMGLFGTLRTSQADEESPRRLSSSGGKRFPGKRRMPPKVSGRPLSPLPALTVLAKIHALIVRRIRLEEVDAKIVMKNHTAVMDPFSAKLYGGTVKGSVVIDFNHGIPVVRKRVSLDNVAIAPLLSDMKPEMKEKFTGRFFGRAKGEGLVGAPSTYKGVVDFHVEKGSIQNVSFLKVAAGIMKLPSLINLRFDTLKGNALIGNGIVRIEAFNAKGQDVVFNVKGEIGFDKKLDLSALLEMPYKVIRKGLGKRSDLFKDREDAEGRKWSLIPLRIRGTLDKPLVTVKFEKKAIDKLIEKNIHDKKLKKFLKKLFN